MRVFLTGSTGFLGSAIRDALLNAGHEVTPLLRANGGDLRAPSTYRDVALRHDVIVHAAIESGPDRLDADRMFIDAVAGPTLVYTSVMFVLGNVDGGDESSPAHGQRAEHERIVLDAGGAVVRPGMIWGGDAWLFAHPITIDGGENRWPLVHRDDVAELDRLIVEQRARGIFHAVSEVRRARDVFPDASVPLEEAREKLGVFADALALDQNVSAQRSHAIGWQPTRRWR